MSGKHHQSPFVLLSRHRYPFIVGVVLLCIAVAGVLAAIDNRRSPDPPLLIVPVQTSLPSPRLIPPSAVPPSPSPSRTASRRPSPSRPPSRSPSVRPASFTAQYVITDGRRSTFQVEVVVKNTGAKAGNWQVVVTHNAEDGVRVFGSAGSTVSTSGNTTTLSGGPLGAGKSVTAGFRAFHRSQDTVRPASCKIDGRACTVTTRRYRNDSPPRTR